MNPIAIPIVLFVCVFGMIVLVSYFSNQRKTRTVDAQLNVYNRMIEKFGSSAEFAEFLKSGEGKHLMDSFGVEKSAPMDKILSSLKFGITLTLLGIGFFVLSFTVPVDPGDDNGFLIAGVIVLCIGLGLLISSFVAQRISRAHGLLPPTQTDTRS